MKYIKIILILLVFVGAIYGVFSLVNSGNGGSKIEAHSPELLSQLTKNVDNDWDNADSWDQKVYEKSLTNANVYKNDLEKLKPGNYTTLLNYINEKVCNKLVEFANNEFAKTDCSTQKIAEYKSAMDYFMQKNGTINSSDARISKLYAKIKLYNDIINFGKKQFALSPGFNIHTGEWNNFSLHEQTQRKNRDGYKSNPNYSSISHISNVKKSLDSVDGKLKSARNSFMINLSSTIISSYQNMARTQENFTRLNDVYKRYYNSYEDGDKLSNFRKQFRKQLEDSERMN